jgi:hypothetical protein
LEYREVSNTSVYVHTDPDDGLHSLTFAMLAGEFYLQGDFRSHQNSIKDVAPQVAASAADLYGTGPDDTYYT